MQLDIVVMGWGGERQWQVLPLLLLLLLLLLGGVSVSVAVEFAHGPVALKTRLRQFA